jgi:hypothetical protein
MDEIKTALRVLTFRATRDELTSLNRKHLRLGLIMTWLVGIGRWWEDPRANLFQHLGIGSVIYIFVLAFFLWLIIWPACVETRPSYFNLLTFISLTAPPAILYAIPIRTMFDVHTGQTIRLCMLALVAGWRVALLAFYLTRGLQFGSTRATVITVLPLTIIVVSLALVNLEKVVFDFMGGAHPEDMSVNDSAYGVLFLISMLSFFLFLPFLIAYAACVIDALKTRRQIARLNTST